MSDFDSSREIWRQLLATESILRICQINLPAAFDQDDLSYVGPRTSKELMARFERYLPYLEELRRLDAQDRLSELLLALESGRDADWSIKDDLAVLSESLEQSLVQIPASVGKAKGYLAAQLDIGDFFIYQDYDAACLLKEFVSAETIREVVVSWKESLRTCVAAQERPIEIVQYPREEDNDSEEPDTEADTIPNFEPTSHIFWISCDNYEVLDAISHYRFMEIFDIGEFRKMEMEIEGFFAFFVTERPHEAIIPVWGDTNWLSIAYRLLMASRSPKLCGRIRRFIEIALTRIANQQHPNGWWPSGVRQKAPGGQGLLVEDTPGSLATGLACVTLLRLSRQDLQLERARDGVLWLIAQQESNGSWLARRGAGSSPEPHLMTTLLAAEAIRLSGIDGLDSTLSLADDWLMSQQKPDGTWVDSCWPFPFSTILAIEYFENRNLIPATLGGYLSIARDFVLRSRELVFEDNENSRRLAIVAAFQGIEAFLYACLSDPIVSIKVFEKPDQTVGMRKALTQLQTHFQTAKVLKQDQVIEWRNEMDRLAYHRDEIVHKGATISGATANELIEAAVKFMNLNSQRVFRKALF